MSTYRVGQSEFQTVFNYRTVWYEKRFPKKVDDMISLVWMLTVRHDTQFVDVKDLAKHYHYRCGECTRLQEFEDTKMYDQEWKDHVSVLQCQVMNKYIYICCPSSCVPLCQVINKREVGLVCLRDGVAVGVQSYIVRHTPVLIRLYQHHGFSSFYQKCD